MLLNVRPADSDDVACAPLSPSTLWADWVTAACSSDHATRPLYSMRHNAGDGGEAVHNKDNAWMQTQCAMLLAGGK